MATYLYTPVDDDKLTLGSRVSFTAWRIGLQGRLSTIRLLGNLFHDMKGVRPIPMPTEPKPFEGQERNDWVAACKEFEKKFEDWTHGETQSKQAIIARLSPELISDECEMPSAKELYKSLALTRATSASAPYEKTFRQLFQHKFIT